MKLVKKKIAREFRENKYIKVKLINENKLFNNE